jgi:hypothetical protein
LERRVLLKYSTITYTTTKYYNKVL